MGCGGTPWRARAAEGADIQINVCAPPWSGMRRPLSPALRRLVKLPSRCTLSPKG